MVDRETDPEQAPNQQPDHGAEGDERDIGPAGSDAAAEGGSRPRIGYAAPAAAGASSSECVLSIQVGTITIPQGNTAIQMGASQPGMRAPHLQRSASHPGMVTVPIRMGTLPTGMATVPI